MTVCAKFHAYRVKSQGEVRKIWFSSFRDLAKKNYRRKWAWPMAKWFGAIQGIWGYKVFECATYVVGVIAKNLFTLIIAPPSGGHMSFFVAE